MNKFLGKRLEDLIPVTKVGTNETKVIKVMGPLSNAYTHALNVELCKEEENDNPQPTVEGFTDPKMISAYIADVVKNAKGSTNPLNIYVFDDANYNEKTIVEVATIAAIKPDYDDFFVIHNHIGNKGDYVSNTSTKEYTYLNHALEAICNKLDIKYITNNDKLKASLESHYHG